MKEDQKKVLKAWIDGAAIQYKSSDGSWGDCHDYGECDRVYFNDGSIYRIKPKISITEVSVFEDGTSVEINDLFKANLRLTFENGELRKAEVI